MLSKTTGETSRPNYISIGKDNTDLLLTSRVKIAKPLCCLGHDSAFLIRDMETNTILGLGKVLKHKPSERDPDAIRKEYQSSELHNKLTSSFRKLRQAVKSSDQKDDVEKLKSALQLLSIKSKPE